MSMGTMPRTPQRSMSQPVARPGVQPMSRSTVQPVTGGRTTLAQRQAMTPFRNYNKPTMAKVDPLAQQQQFTPPMATNFPEFPNVGLPDYGLGGIDNSSFMPGTPGNNPGQGYIPEMVPFSGQPQPQQNYNGQLDLTGMMGQPQNAQTVPPSNMSQLGASGAVLNTGPSNSNAGYGGGKGMNFGGGSTGGKSGGR